MTDPQDSDKLLVTVEEAARRLYPALGTYWSLPPYPVARPGIVHRSAAQGLCCWSTCLQPADTDAVGKECSRTPTSTVGCRPHV